MIDKKLEWEIQEVQDFVKLWNQFFSVLEEAAQRELIDEWDEKSDSEFLKMKAQLAFRKQSLLDSLGKDEFNMAKDIKKVLSMCPSRDILSGESAIKINTIRGVWHEVFIALNKLIGTLKVRKRKLEGISEFSHRSQKILKSKAFKFGAIGVVSLVAIGIVAAVVPWGSITEWVQGLLNK